MGYLFMKFSIFLGMVFLAGTVSAVQMQCGNLAIVLDESTLKTTMTDVASGNVMVTYPTLNRRLLNAGRQTYADTYFFPNNQVIMKNAVVYIYSQKNNSGVTVVPDTRCRIDNP